VAIDRTSNFVFVALHQKADRLLLLHWRAAGLAEVPPRDSCRAVFPRCRFRRSD